MKKTVILAVLVLGLMVNVGKAHALNPEKFGPVLIDGDDVVTQQSSYESYF